MRLRWKGRVDAHKAVCLRPAADSVGVGGNGYGASGGSGASNRLRISSKPAGVCRFLVRGYLNSRRPPFVYRCGFNLRLLISHLTGIEMPPSLKGCKSVSIWAPLARWGSSRDYLKRF